MIKLDQISLPIGYTLDDIKSQICKKLRINKTEILSFEILKLSVDARKKPDIKYVSSIGVSLRPNIERKFSKFRYQKFTKTLSYPAKVCDKKIYVIGFGPSGIFSALALARMGLKPIIIEQGKMVDEREKDVKDFWDFRKLNKYSNVQFGEGGAGTFSDGKLNTNLNNDYCKIVTNELVAFGAPQEIAYLNKPHIGSDKLKNVVKNIREHIKTLGGTFMFSTKLVDIGIKDNSINCITVQNVETGARQVLPADKVLLCVGHSARDVFEFLHQKNVSLAQKPFAMGVRIEQKQKDINFSQYGKEYIEGLPPADYKLAVHLPNGRAVFTFCMCPGGEVVASSSDDGEIVTNGMSNFARDKENANSALLVNVNPEDFGSPNPLAGIYYQAKYEKLAFELGGKNFNAPAQSVGSFLGKDISSDINYSYKPNITICDIAKCLPDFVVDSLKEAIPMLNNKLSNFAKDQNLLIAVESRSSCPLTIIRDDSLQSSIKGLYPVGEGAGYAGGIMSSSQDGIKVAESIYKSI